MEQFTTITSHFVALNIDHIDTDQIIPARYLKTTEKHGLGKHLFADWRYAPTGLPKPEFPLNYEASEEAQFLVVGDNFGCGSSREHAPWSLMDHGFKAIISTSFADIFRNNALKNGLLPVEIDQETLQQLFSLHEEDPTCSLTIDLDTQRLVLPDGRMVAFPIDAFSKTCLREGVDQLGYLLNHELQIATYEQKHPARVDTSLGDPA